MHEEPAIGSRWRHLKRGTTYRVQGGCIIEATMQAAVIYVAEVDGTSWVRPLAEFMDGRFSKIEEI